MFACWAIGGLFTHLAYIPVFDLLASGLLIGSIIPAFIGIKRGVWGYPQRVKPQWLINAERRRDQGI